ncbi:fibroin heavy chain-like isoform X4 [Sarcophilus harrisii]|uniref:fibroin heavy chain-like isoform X4 n=1 Tax=Sarcophilus harrisii TaxID=9305 RepID=UPI001301DA12|nr:fibroin heavy chain-like isoform X4 [Sarcophilus harrisii]
MDSWVFPTSMLLLCLIQGSQQGGLAPQGNGIMGWFFSSTHMKGIPPGAGPGAGAGIPPGKAGYGTLSNGYGTGAPNGAGAGPQGPETKAGYRNGLGAGIFPGAGAQPGLGGGMKPQKAAYRNGLGNGAFPGAGAQPGLGAGTKPQKPGYGNGLGNGIFPGVGAQPGGGMKPQKAGFGAGTKIQNAGNGNGLEAGAFPEARAQPGPCNGGSIPALPPRPPNGVGPATGSPSEKGGFRTQNGYGPVSPPGLENGLKTQKTGLRNILGAGSFPGARIQPGYGAMNGYGTGLGGVKSQNTGYGNGFGAGAFPETGPQPGFGTLNGFGGGPGGVKPRKAIYSNGLGAGTFPEVQQTGFPGAGSYAANGYSNGYGAGGPGYPKPSLYENGGASSFGAQGVPFLSGGSETGAKTAKHDFGNGVGTGSYPADESPPGLYGQLRPEPVPGTYGGPDVKHNFNGFLGNGYRGRCPPGKC